MNMNYNILLSFIDVGLDNKIYKCINNINKSFNLIEMNKSMQKRYSEQLFNYINEYAKMTLDINKKLKKINVKIRLIESKISEYIFNIFNIVQRYYQDYSLYKYPRILIIIYDKYHELIQTIFNIDPNEYSVFYCQERNKYIDFRKDEKNYFQRRIIRYILRQNNKLIM